VLPLVLASLLRAIALFPLLGRNSLSHFPSSVSSSTAAAAMAATAAVQEAPTSTEIDQLTRIRLELATLDQIR
jgi:hypothetical protein